MVSWKYGRTRAKRADTRKSKPKITSMEQQIKLRHRRKMELSTVASEPVVASSSRVTQPMCINTYSNSSDPKYIEFDTKFSIWNVL